MPRERPQRHPRRDRATDQVPVAPAALTTMLFNFPPGPDVAGLCMTDCQFGARGAGWVGLLS